MQTFSISFDKNNHDKWLMNIISISEYLRFINHIYCSSQFLNFENGVGIFSAILKMG
jgi:hypothetical protein